MMDGSPNLSKSISRRALQLGMTVCIEDDTWDDFCAGTLEELKLVPVGKNAFKQLLDHFRTLGYVVKESSPGSKKYTVTYCAGERSASISEVDAVPEGGLRYSLNGFLCKKAAGRLHIFSQGLGKGRHPKVLAFAPARAKRKREKKSNNPNPPAKRSKEKEESEYCYCKEIRDENLMVECKNEFCQHGGWFHHKCAKVTEKYLEGKDWWCRKCAAVELERRMKEKHGEDWRNVLLNNL